MLGSIRADGQVYVINRNGIIFGGASQVNVSTLVASSLPINDNLISRGLLNNPDAQSLLSGLTIPAGASTPAFVPEPPNPA
ncbi:MAG: filamentous hemagglutinin N-terminal domain-containing protein, partial [Devosia sp.]